MRRDDRIKAHFTTCYLALVLFRYLEKNLDYKYTCSEIISTLKNMNFYKTHVEGYVPTYTRTDLTFYITKSCSPYFIWVYRIFSLSNCQRWDYTINYYICLNISIIKVYP